MTTLLIGFDSAWTPNHSGALAGVLQLDDGTFHELGPPRIVNFPEAQEIILQWQAELGPTATIVLLDQPTIVKNTTGQRPVDNLVGSPVSLRYGGMQPANTGKEKMFGQEAPVWPFLERFGGPANPLAPLADTLVFETYPVLTMIALGWMLPDSRAAGRLPKYNPARRKTYSNADWRHVCGLTSCALRERGLLEVARWIDDVALNTPPRKSDQDRLDACLCLLVALDLAQGKDCLMVGDLHTGYIVVPYGAELYAELETRCNKTCREPSEWVRTFQLSKACRE
jgi:predicted RNase H-like nuclease